MALFKECSRIEDLIISSVFHTLRADEYSDLENHLKSCSSCRILYRKYSAIYYATSMEENPAIRVDWSSFTRDLIKRIDSERTEKEETRKLIPLKWVPALLSLLLLGLYFTMSTISQKNTLPGLAAEKISLQTQKSNISKRQNNDVSVQVSYPPVKVRHIPDHPIYIVPVNPEEKASIIVDVSSNGWRR